MSPKPLRDHPPSPVLTSPNNRRTQMKAAGIHAGTQILKPAESEQDLLTNTGLNVDT